MSWWSDWLILLLVASGVLLIFKGGIALIILLWVLYLANGAKTVKAIPSEENEQELANHTIIGIIVVVVALVLTIAVALD